MAAVPHGVLPPGVHWATLTEIEGRFTSTDHRRWLFEGLVEAANALRRAGCRTLYLGGSFVTGKERPGDYDGCWDPSHVQAALLDRVFLDFENDRAAQKWAYRGEMFISTMSSGQMGTFFEFLQVERDSGEAVGIIGIRLRSDVRLSP